MPPTKLQLVRIIVPEGKMLLRSIALFTIIFFTNPLVLRRCSRLMVMFACEKYKEMDLLILNKED
jgi:hypothetical protein